MDAALEELRDDLKACQALETALRGRPAELVRSRSKGVRKPAPSPVQPGLSAAEVQARVKKCLEACKESRKRHREKADPPDDLSDEALSQYTRFTDETALDVYKQFLHYVPRLVNVVTLAEAIPMPGSGVTLPLDLKHIASRCVGSYFAPKRFAAVQLAFATPRCRVLVFHTGRLVGTGTSSASAARLAIARAQRQLADQAGVHVHVRNFQVINQVGAVSLQATLNCDAFATEHSAESHFDRSSFVGLAWRPPREDICCEIYSTGRANLPGSVAERQLLGSFSRMLPELLRFSSASHLLAKIPEDQQAHHRVARPAQGATAGGGAAANAGATGTSAASSSGHAPVAGAPVHVGRARKHLAALDARTKPARAPVQPKKPVSIWDGWGDAEPTAAQDGADLAAGPSGGLDGSDGQSDDNNEDGFDLEALGL